MKSVEKIIKLLKKEYPDARISLNFKNNFQLLVAVILSAQCTDERVNKVTPALFGRFTNVKDFATCNIAELEKMIFSTGFYKNKARNIKAAAQIVVSKFGSRVPDNMNDLLGLPGVARKTANVVLHAAFGRSDGIVVDTHVARLCGLLGFVDMKLSKAKSAFKIEEELMRIVPKIDWGVFSFLLIDHGRAVCVARRPKCKECVLNKLCPSARLA